MQVPEAALSAARESYSLTPIDRLLITMPYTFTAFEYCATSLDRARLFGVVSVMRRNADGSWYGDMLDGLALCRLKRISEQTRRVTANGDQMVEAVQEMMRDFMTDGWRAYAGDPLPPCRQSSETSRPAADYAPSWTVSQTGFAGFFET
jgi:hypothetical protein